MEYIVVKTKEINPSISSLEWEKATIGYIDKPSCTNRSPIPKTTFKLLRGPEGISVLFHTEEQNLRAEVTEENGSVYEDSCMEFFFKPSPWDINYLNFEVNPKGVMHLGIGKDRYGRTLIYEDRKTFDIVSIANDGDWTLKFYIPDEFLYKYFDKFSLATEGNITSVARGNFYKYGAKKEPYHAASWSPVETTKGDFHLPDFFGKIRF